MRAPLLWLSVLACGGARWAPVTLADPPPRTLFRDVAVFDPVAGALTGRHDVLVAGDRIVAVLPPGLGTSDAIEVDGTGRTLLPGFLDAHVHTGSPPGPPGELVLPDVEGMQGAWLAAGVTSVWDLGGFYDRTAALAKKTALGEVAGPAILPSHVPITQRDGHPYSTAKALLPAALRPLAGSVVLQVDGPEDAEGAVAEVAETGAGFIKVIDDDLPPGTPRMAGETLAALTSAAHARGLRVVVHIGDAEGMRHAVDAGVDLLAHGPWQGGVSDADIAALAAAGTPVIPTLHAFEATAEMAAGTWTPEPGDRDGTPGALWGALSAPARPLDDIPLLSEFGAAIDPGFGGTIRRMHDAGVPLLVGSDAPLPGVFPGTAWHAEVDALVAAGIPPGVVLSAATGAGAGTPFADPSAGRIEAGRRADLVLVEGDPVADPEAVHAIVDVWRLGRRVIR